MLKSVSVYDKMKQLVAINQMSASIIAQKSESLRQHFDSEEELQDLMTKRILEQSLVNDDDADLGEDQPQYEMSGMMGDYAKAKTKNIS